VIGNSDRAISLASGFHFMNPILPPIVIPADKRVKFSRGAMGQAKKIGIQITNSPAYEFRGENGQITQVVMEDGSRVDARAVFIRMGSKRKDYFLDKGNIKPHRDRDGFIEVNFRTFESSIPNLFAVGPCNNGPDQVIIAGGEGALAAFQIHGRILTEAGI
jgi:thioredoxin reductase (NADPH)